MNVSGLFLYFVTGLAPIFGTPDVVNKGGQSALFRAVLASDQDQITSLLRWGANPNQPTAQGSYPLHEACARLDLPVIAQLLEGGAFVHQYDAKQLTPIMIVAGVVPEPHFHTKRKTDCGICPTHREKIQKAITLLLSYGADINQMGPEFGHSVFSLVAPILIGKGELFEFLLDNGARPNLGWGTDFGTALHRCAQDNHLEAARVLLGRGADPRAQDSQGQTPSLWTDSDAMMHLLDVPLSSPNP
jgi:ankyrin repeat protein